jgi:hypothetical protein
MMSCLGRLYRKEKLISRTLDIDEELYYKLEFLSNERYDASISKLVNISIEELVRTENVQIYKRKNNSYVSRSFLLRESVLDGLYELKSKYRIPIYLLVNIAIRNVLIDEDLL